MSSLQSLTALLPPPSQPEAAPMDYDWSTFEEVERLSDSYKSFVTTYGTGVLCGCVNLFSPSGKTVFNTHIVTNSVRATILTIARAGAKIPDLVSCDRFFPMDKLGLFVVAESIDGHDIFYERTSDTQRENVLVYDSQSELGGVATRFDMGVVEFFEAIFSHKIQIPGLSAPLIRRPVFEPLKTSWLVGIETPKVR